MQRNIPCMIIRGGTSKGIYLLEKDLPSSGDERDALLLKIMGSPDLRQIDGLGGATSVTSKIAILAPSSRPGVDVDYTFAQVSIDKPMISYAGNCGNISAGVGPFAIESGLKKAGTPITTVRMFNTNTNKLMLENVQTPDGKVTYEGDYVIPGVPGSAAPIKIMMMDPAGTVCNALLPTGNPIDTLNVPGFGELPVSLVDAANPLVFVRAHDVGMSGTESPQEIDCNAELTDLLERIRGEAARQLGFVEEAAEAAWKSPGVPKLTIVSPSKSYQTTQGQEINADEIDLLGRMMSMQKAHPTYAMTGAMCTAAAAVIPGTIVFQVKRDDAAADRFRIAHPGGILEAGVDYVQSDKNIEVTCAYGFRTARLLMRGTAYL